MTKFEALISLIGGIAGLLILLITATWRLKGYLDRLNATDARLVTAVDNLQRQLGLMYRENQMRFRALENKRNR